MLSGKVSEVMKSYPELEKQPRGEAVILRSREAASTTAGAASVFMRS